MSEIEVGDLVTINSDVRVFQDVSGGSLSYAQKIEAIGIVRRQTTSMWYVEFATCSARFDADELTVTDIGGMTKRENNRRPYDYWLQMSIEEEWEFPPDRCPHCQNGAVIHSNQNERGDYLHGYIECWCDWCGKSWSERTADEWEFEDESESDE